MCCSISMPYLRMHVNVDNVNSSMHTIGEWVGLINISPGRPLYGRVQSKGPCTLEGHTVCICKWLFSFLFPSSHCRLCSSTVVASETEDL